ncbi:hypothetical protein M885DRAFT_550271 [Pelagophyceae sp. CCMP2097]|nr:hypothetical protein M885DRAFT_550271 [Pelagophyceae sp. CCMP2097]|mmetsp:Transcript_11074/g.38466  ORF Transcript_11074/g.38466 Transcript_11074/m.38466 type:complete len:498 (+) Transcript_11074:158-1651(+)
MPAYELDLDSPRLLDACLRRGILPDDLKPAPANAFKHPSRSEEEVLKRADFFEKRRSDKVAAVLACRDDIVRDQALLDLTASGKLHSDLGVSQSSGAVFEVEQEGDRKRIAAIKRRQEKELQRLVAGEQQMGELQLRFSHAEKEEKLKVVAVEKRRKACAKTLFEKNKGLALKKAEKACEEEAFVKSLAAKERDREAKRHADDLALGQERLIRLKDRDASNSLRLLEQGQRSQVALNAILVMAEESQLKLLEREAQLSRASHANKVAKAAQVEALRIKAEQRLAKAALHSSQRLAAERLKYESTQADALQRVRDKTAASALQARRDLQSRNEKDKMRLARTTEALELRQERRLRIVQSREKKDLFSQALDQDRKKLLAESKLDVALARAHKSDCVEQQRRISEYHRLKLLEKVQQDDYRNAVIKAKQSAVVEARKASAQEGFMRKHRIRVAMENMRITNKYISLDSIIDGPMSVTQSNDDDEPQQALNSDTNDRDRD